MLYKNFLSQLNAIGMKSSDYLDAARKQGRINGYNYFNIELSDKPDKKLMYNHNGVYVHFGAVGYGDYIIYKHLEKIGDAVPGYAAKKRKVFKASHLEIEDKGKYSPNQLALNINW